MNFAAFISRADETFIEKVVGKSAIQILQTLDPASAKASRLQEILLNVYSPIDLLSNKETRHELFDILKPNEVQELLAFLGKTNLRSYEDLKSIRFNEKELPKLLAFFEIEYQKIESKDVAADTLLPVSYGLFKHQRKAVNNLNEKLYKSGKRVMLHMPTGAGKTRTAMNVVCNHLRNNEPTIVIWLAHTEELCEQAASEFENAWSKLGNREVQIIRYWGNSNFRLENLTDGFIVAGFAKLFNLLKVDAGAISKLASKCSLTIMDEAHMAIAPSFQLNLSVLTSFNSSLLGLSATPGRTWNRPEDDEQLSNFFQKQKVTLSVEGYSNPVDYLVSEGYLAKVNNTKLLYKSGFTISEQDLDYLRNNLHLPDKFLRDMSQDQQRNILIIQKVEELIVRHNRIILFALNVEHSDVLAVILQARGINAYSVTSKTDPFTRKKLISDFKAETSGPMVLCNYGILTTGFDAPKTSCALIARPTDSLVLYSQMVGRAIRGRRAGGNDDAEIVTVVDTCLPGFDNIANAFFNWEDVW
jgi:superfamily II DNA or RNA helicase